MNPAWFSGRLKELREAKGLTQAELAELAGLSQRAISHWEQGQREPLWSNILTLCAALGVLPEAFMEAPEDRPPTPRGRPPKEQPPPPPRRPPGRPRKGG